MTSDSQTIKPQKYINLWKSGLQKQKPEMIRMHRKLGYFPLGSLFELFLWKEDSSENTLRDVFLAARQTRCCGNRQTKHKPKASEDQLETDRVWVCISCLKHLVLLQIQHRFTLTCCSSSQRVRYISWTQYNHWTHTDILQLKQINITNNY